MKYEKSYGYGDSKSFKFWYLGDNFMEYRETAVIKLFCDFDFTNFPFDSHECHLTFGDEMYTSDVILLESSTVQYSGKGCKKVIPNMMHVCVSRHRGLRTI